MIPNFKVLNKQTNEFIPSEDIIIQRGKLYLNYRDFEDDIHLPSENYEVMFEESKKKTIPKFAHEFIQEGIDSGSDYFTIIICADSFANAKPQDEFSKWLRENSSLFIRSLLNGYEVEKEPLYRVVINNRYLAKMSNFSDVVILVSEDEILECATESYELTEKQIKAIDERYWAFAVPVEEG
ncbi:DUF1642 domain-containing protein [Enterococcus faecium]|uniref:DUF1642 domain-containing protein n=1 Tax=Enterococcus faecium TaxID=1352 RepID=UPI000A33D75F|nr:DUF1642 domain-containing protein [Enterococcus faecium]OTN92420.1 hypothetical protein A5809_001809 [Enterococcus faecium]